jgi:type II secretory pathway pseudopilin PulG
MPSKSLKHIRTSAGFTYVGLLILVAIMGVTLAAIGTFWHIAQQRAKEQQLLFIGNQFSQAINAYYQNAPAGVHQYPKRLEDLLLDTRQPVTARYLRKIFTDPFTSTTQWGLIKGADGGIVGVHSLSNAAPLKQAGFGKGAETFADKTHLSDWRFIYSGGGAYSAAGSNGAMSDSQNSGTQFGGPNKSLAQLNSGNANVSAQVAASVKGVAPAYQVPVPDPLPPDPTPSERKLRLCQNMRVTDASTCALLAAKFGEADGMICMTSANQRYSLCSSTDIVALPPLAVRYK